MTTLPSGSDLGGSPTYGQYKTAIQAFRTFVADLLGTDSGNKPAARAALGITATGETLVSAASKGAARAAVDLPSTIAAKWGHRVGVNQAGDALPLIGPDLGFRNIVTNGDFRLWQRGTSFNNPNGAYTADRWIVYFGAGNTVVVSRQVHALGDLPGEPRYFFRVEKTAGSGAAPEVYQRAPGVRLAVGKKVTASFYARTDVARQVVAGFVQNYGTGGSPSSPFSIGGGTLNLTTAWAWYSVTADIPSIAAKTLGSNDDDYLALALNWGTNANGRIDTSQVQWEEGEVATPFERRPDAIEEWLAGRFYFKSYDVLVAPGTAVGTDIEEAGVSLLPSGVHAVRKSIRFPVPMRRVPGITLYDAAGASGNWTGCATATAVQVGRRSVSIEGVTGTTTDGRIAGHLVADAEI